MTSQQINLRETIPVIGTGFNRWLLRPANPAPLVTGWWDLLRAIATRGNLHLVDPDLESALAADGDPTFAWEALVHANRLASKNPESTTGDAEKALLRELAALLTAESSRLAAHDGVRKRAASFIEVLGRGPGNAPLQCDIVSLNFDRVLQDAWADAAGPREVTTVQYGAESDTIANASYAVSREAQPTVHFWYPHGEVMKPNTMVGGVVRYARSTQRVLGDFAAFRKTLRDRKAPAGETEQAPRGPQNARRVMRTEIGAAERSWLSVAIDSPLLLLGVGMSRSESDLWTFLHLRARNHAKLRPEDRPPILRLTSDEEKLEHRAIWKSLPPGIRFQELRLGKTWDAAWDSLLGHLNLPSAAFP